MRGEVLNLLDEPLIRIRRTGTVGIERVSLPELFVILADDAVASFPALRAHQRFAWHAFLVQLAAIALHRVDRIEPPASAEAWADLLRALTPDHPDDAPWCLVAPHDRPAFLQAAVPGGDVGAFKAVPSPDALDMLVTSRNHDLKRAAMVASELDDWLMALITVQTMVGGLSGSYRGIARMNSDYGSRPCVSVRPEGGAGAWLVRDVRTLLRCRAEIARTHSYPETAGHALLWVTTWDGRGPVYRRDQLDPLFIEICRRVRFEAGMSDRIRCLKSTNKSLIAGGFRGGITGDPWTPINIGDEKIFTISDKRMLGYRQCIDLMDGALFRPSPLQLVGEDDSEHSLSVFAAAMVRASGKTAGYHERRVPISKAVRRLLSVGAADRIAAAGHARAELVGKLSYRVLRPALHCLLREGRDAERFPNRARTSIARQTAGSRGSIMRLIRPSSAICGTSSRRRTLQSASGSGRIGFRTGSRRPQRSSAKPATRSRSPPSIATAHGPEPRACSGTSLRSSFRSSTRRGRMPQPPPEAREIVARLAAELAAPSFPRGDLAALRRMDPDAPGRTPVVLRLLARRASDRLEHGADELRRWALVLQGMALMAPEHHRTTLPVGRALFGPGSEPLYAESRLARLLSARGAAFRAQVPRLARQLRAKDQALDWRELADLILAEGRNEARAEEARERIARDYYRTEAAGQKTKTDPMQDAKP